MTKLTIIKYQLLFLRLGVLFLILSLFFRCQQNENAPFTVKSDVFNQNEEDSLGLKSPIGLETFTIFKPTDSTDHFSNGAVMIKFKNQLFCQWQSSDKNEDSEDTWVAYSHSSDGKSWSKPKALAESPNNGIRTSGGWWVYGDTLVAFINEWPSEITPKGGFTYYKTTSDGLNWSGLKPVLLADGQPLNGVFEQDPHQLSDGRIITTAHRQPGLIATPIYTDEPLGVSGWKTSDFSNLSIKNNVSREIEPSWFLQDDNTVVMVFRDQESSHRTIAATSKDRGESWSTPVLTSMLDSRSKQSAGNLHNGTAFLVNNPVNHKMRMPLVITLSENGKIFNSAFVLRKGINHIQELRYPGTYKRLGYHYPKSFLDDNYLYVSYTTNKEDVEYTRVPLSSLNLN